MKLVFYLCFYLVLTQENRIKKKVDILIDDILKSMSLAEKIGQTAQVDFIYLNDAQGKTQYHKIKEWNLGSLLVGGNGCPDDESNITSMGSCINANNSQWKKVADLALAQGISVIVNISEEKSTTVIIKPLLGTDAIRGNQHSVGEILFPHNIGLAASNNVENFKNSAKWMRDSVIESGFNFVFSPTVAVSHNPQWGRFYETLGENTDKVKQFSKAFVKEAQNIELETEHIHGVLTSVKHFIGDGATINGYEEGDSIVDQQFMDVFIQNNIKGYEGAIEAQTGNIMVSYDAINGVAMSVHPFVNSILKASEREGGLGFEGFVISDYNSVIKSASFDLPRESQKIPLDKAYADSFNVGVDMQMISENVEDYQTLIEKLVNETDQDKPKIDVKRLDDAVRRILAIKDKMGLIEYNEVIVKKYNLQERKKLEIVKDKEQEYQDALQAALQSLVLLKNQVNTLPVNKNSIENIILLGDRYIHIGNGQYKIFSDFDNIGAQNGGWTIRWQGYNGNDYWSGDLKNKSKASSILDAIKKRFQDTQIYYSKYSDPTNLDAILEDRNNFRNLLIANQDQFSQANTIVIHVLAENPYAEYMGDINCKYCQTKDKKGCLYNQHDNLYQTESQATRLEIKTGTYEKQLINNILKGQSRVITVLLSGRPMLIEDPLSFSDAFIAAWLPGTTGGEAIVKSIFGEYGFGGTNNSFNKLPSPWISTLDSIKDYPKYDSATTPKIEDPRFNTGFGLETTSINYSILE
ncbi:unnamed protein product [Paramecium pentaurelia]|uniref:beta-glucosidase n=1 Tax=Paramecium pentaurelia TaxID=43138 RepID=A0A8S1VBR2_9CILI|nr:unnamed protein product [Paramecium pentaurelia]